jgi:hypothetical protein
MSQTHQIEEKNENQINEITVYRQNEIETFLKECLLAK